MKYVAAHARLKPDIAGKAGLRGLVARLKACPSVVCLLLAFWCCGAAHAQSCVTASQVTLTGFLRASNGLPSSNDQITLTPSQVAIVAGCGVNTMATTACATSVDGSVVQTGNPLAATITSSTLTGTLASGTYYVTYGWYDALGHVTLAAPETVQQLSAQGSLVVSSPAGGLPATAVGMNVYIGTASGGETLQGQTVGLASFNQAVPLVSGASLPGSNGTVCVATANDSMWPYGTGYVVTMEDSSGNALPGYPMQWQLDGAGTTINLSNGLPYYHGVIYYPTPILSAPQGHATQSISGSLNMTGYNLLNVGKLGVGTALPAWPIDVENGAINASGGYILNGGIGVSTGNCLTAGSDPYHTFNVPGMCGIIVEEAGTPLTQRSVLNFDGTVVATDSSSPARTNVGLPAVGTPGTYAQPTSITMDAQGRVIAITAGGSTTPVNRTCTGSSGNFSCYRINSDGTIEEWGILPMPTAGGTLQTTTLTFPYTFGTQSALTVSGGSQPESNDDAYVVYHRGLSTYGATVVARCAVNIGGSGCASLSTSIPINWHAFGN